MGDLEKPHKEKVVSKMEIDGNMLNSEKSTVSNNNNPNLLAQNKGSMTETITNVTSDEKRLLHSSNIDCIENIPKLHKSPINSDIAQSNKEPNTDEKVNTLEECVNVAEDKLAKSAENSVESKLLPTVAGKDLDKGIENLDKLLLEWENFEPCNVNCCSNEEKIKTVTEDLSTESDSSLHTDVNGNLYFWYWEAWEDQQRNGDIVFLFGRLPDGQSITVRVEQIERILYLLPREYVR